MLFNLANVKLTGAAGSRLFGVVGCHRVRRRTTRWHFDESQGQDELPLLIKLTRIAKSVQVGTVSHASAHCERWATRNHGK